MTILRSNPDSGVTAWLHLAATVVATLAVGPHWASAADTDDDANKLAQQVTIRRTQYGVPHIQGESL